MSNQRFSKKASFLVAALLSVSVLTSCSSESADDVQESAVSVNPLAEMTFATSSSDAYKRSCYWGSQGDNIFMLQRMTEGNELAVQEGKLPLAGLEQAMEIVLQEGEPQAPEEYAMIKDFCSNLGFQF
ncbi:unannotated protein [freshwater metagenome]|jgi:hypothetical protein|uniref:Unannotated protein n=1 Tax=freshwater metagenome TaxID=449393 RepID=A0A6J6KNX2_9ZZZZ|nr:hypothetical protein [Actinomycetota bacterium]